MAGELRFRHALVRDAAYEGLPYKRRRDLHARVGTTIERRASNPEDEAERLSLHFFHAQSFDQAWDYSLVAAKRASAIYANSESALYYQRALESARRLPELQRGAALSPGQGCRMSAPARWPEALIARGGLSPRAISGISGVRMPHFSRGPRLFILTGRVAVRGGR